MDVGRGLQGSERPFCEAPSRRMDGQRVPRGIAAAALALAWHRYTEALRRAVRDAHGHVLEDAMPMFARAMRVAAASAAAFNILLQEVERLRQVAVVPPFPVRFDAGDIFGRKASRDGEDKEEPPRNMSRRSLAVDADGHGPSRG